jgi:hypothetical protein
MTVMITNLLRADESPRFRRRGSENVDGKDRDVPKGTSAGGFIMKVVLDSSPQSASYDKGNRFPSIAFP